MTHIVLSDPPARKSQGWVIGIAFFVVLGVIGNMLPDKPNDSSAATRAHAGLRAEDKVVISAGPGSASTFPVGRTRRVTQGLWSGNDEDLMKRLVGTVLLRDEAFLVEPNSRAVILQVSEESHLAEVKLLHPKREGDTTGWVPIAALMKAE